MHHNLVLIMMIHLLTVWVLPPTLLTGDMTHNSFVTPDVVSCCDHNTSNTLFELIDETRCMMIL